MSRRLLRVALPLSLLSLGLLAQAAAARAYRAFVGYQTPFVFTNPLAQPGPAHVDSLVVVLVDGLGLAASRELPFLNELRARGADYACGVGVPSLSMPARGVLFSGAWPTVSGQLTNMGVRPLRVEHLFPLARRRGLTTAIASGAQTQTLAGPAIDERVRYPKEGADGSTGWPRIAGEARQHEAAAAGLLSKRAAFSWVELYLVDEAGHEWGAAAPEYRRAASDADAAVRRLAATLDLSRTTLVVTGDHGHLPQGGHGGPETEVTVTPLILAGAGVRAGSRGRCEQIDVAPTLAGLLGLEIPASNQGRPLLEALALDAGASRELQERVAIQRESFARQEIAWLTGGPDGIAVPAGLDEAEPAARADAAERRIREAEVRRTTADRAARVPVALAAALLPLLAFVLVAATRVLDRFELLLTLLAAAAAFALYHALFPLLGLSTSFSSMNKDEELPFFLLKDAILGLTLAALAAAAAGFVAGGRSRGRSWDARACVAWLVALALAGLFLQRVAYVYWAHGPFLSWRLSDLGAEFRFYLDLTVVIALGFFGPLLPAAAWLGERLRRRAADLAA